MVTHIFNYTVWSMENGEDWECEVSALVVDKGKVIIHEKFNSPDEVNRVLDQYPDMTYHDVSLSLHRGKLESKEQTEQLKVLHPDVWETINNYCKFTEYKPCSL